MTEPKFDFFDVDKIVFYLDENLFRNEVTEGDGVFLEEFDWRMPGKFNVVDYWNRKFRDKRVEVRGKYSVIQEDSDAINIIPEELSGKHSPLLRKLATMNVEKGIFNPKNNEPERYERLRLRFHRDYMMSNGLVIPRGGIIRVEKDEIFDRPLRNDLRVSSDNFIDRDYSREFPTSWFFINGVYRPMQKCD